MRKRNVATRLYLCAEPHLASADDANVCELSSVSGNVFFQPTARTGDHVEDFATVPQTPVRFTFFRKFRIFTSELVVAVPLVQIGCHLAVDVCSLKRNKFRQIK